MKSRSASIDAWLKFLLALAVAAVSLAAASLAVDADPGALIARADQLFDEKNYLEAAALYEQLLETDPRHQKWIHASHRTVACKLRLRLFDEALAAAEAFIERSKGTPHEARAERLTGNLYLLVPHWGTRAGGEFHRAQHMQGIRLQSHQHDKKRSIAHLENARGLYAAYEDDAAALSALPEEERRGWRSERIECGFDLAAACARFNIYENQYHFWYGFWAERDEFLAETAGEEDFSEMHSHRELTRKRPIGLRVDADGQPVFPAKPDAYSTTLSDDEKILYLLDEARRLDRTEEQKFAGLSYYRQAMLARSRFGMDRVNQYGGIYRVGGRQPLQEELETFNPWDLEDDEALLLAGGRIVKAELPEQWNVLQLLRIVAGDYAQSGSAEDAQYATGLYYQSRQQYTDALREYAEAQRRFAGSEQAGYASTQIQRIREPQIHISQTGIQVNGQPAEIQISHRNVPRVWFVAREIDLEGFMRDIRGREPDEQRGFQYFHSLGNWHHLYVNGYQQRYRNEVVEIAAKYLGKEVARWSDEVRDDGTHRYAQATLQTPLQEHGAYLVYGYVSEPPARHADERGPEALNFGKSRAVYFLSDLALVEKSAKDGNLFFVSHAVTGAPVRNASLDVVEVWTTYDRAQRRREHHKETHRLTTNGDGLALLKRPERPQRGNFHVLVKAEEDRLAWTGMRGFGYYRPSRMRDGLFAYCITDRPVYRPEQTVRYKVWLRQSVDGEYRNASGRSVHLEVYDPRGEKVHNYTKQTDQFGGIDGEFQLAEEPSLGVYRIQVRSQNYAGGQNFRVEEYKKPEFEVTVEPGKDHAKLGETVTAVIRAKYYFGEPVTDGQASYRVFREEYRHSYFFPGPWDWLYGQGYGLPWYRPAFSPRHRWISPPWWGGHASPVRELIAQDTASLNDKGEVEIAIDTQSALEQHGDLDHRYIIEAEVTDPSRRVIEGTGDVKATRQAYYAYVQPDRGYVRPGEQFQVRVRCLTPAGEPVRAEGVVTVSEVVFGGPDNARIDETVLQRWRASTDASGQLSFPLRREKSGQIRIRFEAPDAWGETVVGQGFVWVCGRDFDGQLYRFTDLEIITDKRTYEPGETAHVMINTREPNSYVLFSDDVDSNTLLDWRMLHLPQKSQVIAIPVKSTHRPNFFVEATTVRDMRVHEEVRQICVPPEERVLDLSVQADKAEYRPGEEASITLTARGLDGKPARAQLALSVFDKSVLYIQPEYTPEIKGFFHGHTRSHRAWMITNLIEQFAAMGYVHRPFQQLHPLPGGWDGVWGPEASDWRTIGGDELKDYAGGDGQFVAMGRGMVMSEQADSVRMRGAEAAPMAMAAEAARAGDMAEKMAEKVVDDSAEPEMAEAEVRQEFADTALWLATLTTDGDGVATTTVKMPENLTTWKINSWAMTPDTQVGQASAETVTTKNLIVRLQAPRFFVERDEVVISANIHNYLDRDKRARASIELPAGLVELIGDTQPTSTVSVSAGGQTRVDWRIRIVESGTVPITVKAETDEESDAMRVEFPALVHGMTKQIAESGSLRPDPDDNTATVTLEVPEQRRPELTSLEVRAAPTLVSAMLDALPYCLDYPHRTTDNTVNRFFPAVLTLKTLQNMGITLDDLKDMRGRLEEVRRRYDGKELEQIYRYAPIFDQDELQAIIDRGLKRLANMQNDDGGFGWWTGSSSPYFTSYVLYALATAQQADVRVDEGMIQRGMQYLKQYEEQEMRRPHWSVHAQRAFSAYVLSLKDLRAGIETGQVPEDAKHLPGDLVERLWQERDRLNLYGKSLLTLAMANLGDRDRAATVLRNIMQYKEENPDTQVAWFRTPETGWWYWWNSDIETNAAILRAIVEIDPDSDAAPKVVKWLLNNRRNGYYWRSTRDTTLVLAAMSEFAIASGEARPEYTLTLDLDDGAYTRTVRVTPQNFLTADMRLLVEGAAIGSGEHKLKITKEGRGAVYYSVYLKYFSQEEPITAAGHELNVERTYFKLRQIPYTVEVEGAEGQTLKEERLRYERVPIEDGDSVQSGDLIQVELRAKADNDYTFLCFEDMRPAGFEAVDVRSGYTRHEGFYAYTELRDEKAVFFLDNLARGEHLLRYRLRAEVPGRFHALPSILYGMYVPELRANGDEVRIEVED